MAKNNIELIKKLREETGVSVALINKAFTEAEGDYEKAKGLLKQWGVELAAKKSDSAAADGVVQAYIHHNKRMGAIVVLNCQTDFVAKNEEFQTLAHEIAMQVASMDPKNVEDLMKQPFIKDSSKTIADLIKEAIVKLGENVVIGNFKRFAIGE